MISLPASLLNQAIAVHCSRTHSALVFSAPIPKKKERKNITRTFNIKKRASTIHSIVTKSRGNVIYMANATALATMARKISAAIFSSILVHSSTNKRSWNNDSSFSPAVIFDLYLCRVFYSFFYSLSLSPSLSFSVFPILFFSCHLILALSSLPPLSLSPFLGMGREEGRGRRRRQ